MGERLELLAPTLVAAAAADFQAVVVATTNPFAAAWRVGAYFLAQAPQLGPRQAMARRLVARTQTTELEAWPGLEAQQPWMEAYNKASFPPKCRPSQAHWPGQRPRSEVTRWQQRRRCYCKQTWWTVAGQREPPWWPKQSP